MKTIILQEPGRLEYTDTLAPGEPGPGEALVRVHRVGICGTDLHAYRGRQPFFSYPRILGHELGVEILAIGADVSGLSSGDRCAVEPYLNCNKCIACRRGKPNCCVKLQVLGVHADGGMREKIIVPVRKLHRSAVLSFEQLALVETLGIGAHAVARATVEAGEQVLVVGAGPIGLSVVQFAQLAGANVTVLDINEGRLEFCRRQMKVAHIIMSDDPLAELLSITNGDLPTTIFDATGHSGSMQRSFEFVAAGGKLVLVGLVQADIMFNDPHFHRREITLLSSRNSTPVEFQRIVSLMEEGSLDTTPWITHRAECDEMIKHFPTWLDPQSGVIKAMVEF